MTTPQQALNEAKVKAFTQLMISHLTGASVTLMIEIGRRLGLFETMATMPPAYAGKRSGHSGDPAEDHGDSGSNRRARPLMLAILEERA